MLEHLRHHHDEEYQRELSSKSIRQIRKIAANWDWSAFKAPSVARTDDPDLYEVVDGQHTAIAAATNGNVGFLPCLLMDADTLAQQWFDLWGIGTMRKPGGSNHGILLLVAVRDRSPPYNGACTKDPTARPRRPGVA